LGIFREVKSIRNKTVGIAREHITGSKWPQAFYNDFPGVESLVFKDIRPRLTGNWGFPGARMILEMMFQFKKEFEDYFCKVR